MQICNNCKSQVQYIALSSSQVIKCDCEEIVTYTKNGFMHKGFIPHKCKEVKNAKEEN